MARTSIDGWDSESTATSCVVPISKPDYTNDYFVREDLANSTTIKIVAANSSSNLDEQVKFEFQKLPSISGRNLDRLYKPSTQNGYRFSVTDSFIRRTTDSTLNTINDDAVQLKIEFSAPAGSNILSGAQVASMLLHTLGFLLEPTSAGTGLATTQPVLDRLISGATKPYQLV